MALSFTSRYPAFLPRRKKAVTALESHFSRFAAAGLLDKPVGRLSGGELQRVLLAVATLPQPDLLILDEPVSGVDNAGLQLFYEQIDRAAGHRRPGHPSHLSRSRLRPAQRRPVLLLDTSVKAARHPRRGLRLPRLPRRLPRAQIKTAARPGGRRINESRNDMDALFSWWQYDFMRSALFAVLLIMPLFALLGHHGGQ